MAAAAQWLTLAFSILFCGLRFAAAVRTSGQGSQQGKPLPALPVRSKRGKLSLRKLDVERAPTDFSNDEIVPLDDEDDEFESMPEVPDELTAEEKVVIHEAVGDDAAYSKADHVDLADQDLCRADVGGAESKCMGQSPGEVTPTPRGVEGKNLFFESSSSSLLNRTHNRASGLDFECDDEEWKQFKYMYGLEQLSDDCKSQRHYLRKHIKYGMICPKLNVVWIYPDRDPNNAFCVNRNICHRLSNWRVNSCSVQFYSVASVDEAAEILYQYPEDSIKHLVIGGHGNGWAVRFGDDTHCGDGYLCVSNKYSEIFLKVVKLKMQAYGTIFADSCKSARAVGGKPSLVNWLAPHVGKGIRVFGSDVSFAKVRVSRFNSYHVKIHSKNGVDAERIVHVGDTCPSFAHKQGDNCVCAGAGQTCRTGHNERCPAAHGERSISAFLPSCGQGAGREECYCMDSCEHEESADRRCCETVSLSKMRHWLGMNRFVSGEWGDCKCQGLAVLMTKAESGRRGAECKHYGKRTFYLEDEGLENCACAVPDDDHLRNATSARLFYSPKQAGS
eukprot:TRINITY_DN93665_c0_g1_i1.p1 TRINITY_DN93665_c0_g1~~TRINITY_DN93665_c0_g1_i1.p1  ORF type:complete len:559 (-),score=113.89 TRINITY_DN93665_c0_g1_i1:87-1763(-)